MDTEIAYCIRQITNIPDSIFTGDINAHTTLWYSHSDDHRGQLISDIIINSEHIILNTDTPTRVRTQHYNRPPHQTSQNFHNIIQPHNLAHNTRTKLRSHSHNHNNQHTHQIQTTTKHTHLRTIGKQTGHSFLPSRRLLSLIFNHHQIYTLQTPSSKTLHTEKHNIPKGKIHSTSKLLPEHIRHKIEHRNNIIV